jgi:hypothetical protein
LHLSFVYRHNSTTLLGDGLHQRLQTLKGHGEGALGAPLPADAQGFDHNREHPVVGTAGLTRGNAHIQWNRRNAGRS